jgi:uncharacterized membrane protein YphA (DoxX/SURF4 family)
MTMTEGKSINKMNIALWGGQILLACFYAFTGFMKVSQPIDALQAMMGWPASYPVLTRFVGAAELAGAIGLILPLATKIQPRLTSLAAAGLALIQILAILFHLSRSEFGIIPINIVLLALAVWIYRGRRNV